MATVRQGGSYAFELEQTSVTDLTLGTPYSGTLAGSGQAQLFSVSVPATQALFVALQDSTSTDVNQIYAKLGSPPTPGNYAYEFSDGRLGQPAVARPLGGAGDLVHPGLFRVGPAASTFTLSAVGRADHADHRGPGSGRDGEHGHVDPDRSGFNGTTVGRAGLGGRHGLHGHQRERSTRSRN